MMQIPKSSIGLIRRLLRFLKHPLQISQKNKAAARNRVPTFPLYRFKILEHYLFVAVLSVTTNAYYGKNIIDLKSNRYHFESDITDPSEPKAPHFKALKATSHHEGAFIRYKSIYRFPFIVHKHREQRHYQIHATLFLIDYYA
jgi:hypothetical protein